MLTSRIILDTLLIEKVETAYHRYRRAGEERKRATELSVDVPSPDGALMRSVGDEIFYLREYKRILAMQTALVMAGEMPDDPDIVSEFRRRLKGGDASASLPASMETRENVGPKAKEKDS